MGTNEFMGMLIAGIAAIIALLSAIVVPIVKLNATLTRQNTLLDCMLKNDALRDTRINNHGKQLDEHERRITEHEIRIQHLEE